jgi:hypothetical protein
VIIDDYQDRIDEEGDDQGSDGLKQVLSEIMLAQIPSKMSLNTRREVTKDDPFE